MSGPRVVVVGGGIIGVSTAWYLARGGAEVLLLEASRIGAGASSGNAGTIAVGHPPLNRPGRVSQGVRQMLDSTSPLYVKPRVDPGLWKWLAGFARYCTHEHVEHCMSVMGPLGHEALESFDEVRREERIECEYSAGGYYEVCSTEDGFELARAEASLIERYGYAPDVLGPEEMAQREPALGRDIVGAIHYRESASLDPALFLNRLAQAATRRGVVIREGASVTKVTGGSGVVDGVLWTSSDGGPPESEPADHVVLATGATARGLVKPWMRPLPLQPGKGYHRDVDIGPNGAPPLRQACVLAESSVFCTPMHTRVRFAGTMEFSGENHVHRGERLRQLTHAARAAFPTMGTARPLSEWCGLRPMSVDGLPIVGAAPGVQGLHVATGHGMLGLTLGPVTGRMVARDILGIEEASPALSPARFS